MSTNILAVEADMAQTAGALVFWSLSGVVDLDDLIDQLALEGIPEALYPTEPSTEVVVKRAAESCISAAGTTRTLLRPLKRGSWDIVREDVLDADGAGKLKWTPLVRLTVDRQDDGSKLVTVSPYTDADRALAEEVVSKVPTYKGILTATDISGWLLHVLWGYVNAVSLRERGGFYFVPRDEMPKWRVVVACLKAVGNHKLFEIPALQSDEAVEAILTSVRAEVEYAMNELEEYLAGDLISTRGLNSQERTLDEKRVKAARYAELLGVALPDLVDKAVVLQGMINAARLRKDAE